MNTQVDPGTPAVNRSLVFALMLGLFVCGLDTSIVNIILPKLQQIFNVPSDKAMLIATVFMTMMAGFQLIAGRCADIFAPVPIFISGLVLFFVGSLGCALSQALDVMLVGRAVQGVGAAMLTASFGAIILSQVPRRKTGTVMGAVMMVMSTGIIIGPPLGGFLAEYVSWHWAFLINLPLTAASAALLIRALKRQNSGQGVEASPGSHLQQIDLRGAFFSFVILTTLPILFAVGPKKGLTSAPFLGLLLLFLVSIPLFIWTERKSDRPLLDLIVFRLPLLNWALVMKILSIIVLNGVLLVFPFFITGRSGQSVSQAGFYLLIPAMGMSIVTPIAGKMTDRFTPLPVIATSSLMLLPLLAGFLFLGQHPAMMHMVIILAGFGAALGGLMVATSVLILTQASPGKEGIFSALNSLLVPVGGAMGVALFSSLYGRGAAAAGNGLSSHGGFTLAMQGGIVCVLFLVGSVILGYRSVGAGDK